MEAVDSSETLLITYHTAWQHFPEDSHSLLPHLLETFTVYYSPTEVAAVWLGCGQQIVKRKPLLSNVMQIHAMILEL